MEKIALIISFEYEGISYLPGAIVDIYRMYSALIHMGYDKITIITDSNPSDRELYDYTTKNTDVDVTIYSMRNVFTKYRNKRQVIDAMEEVLKCSKGLLYYSGHSMGGKLILPNETHIDINGSISSFIHDYELLDILSSVKDPTHETMLVFDCCHGSNFLLPYKYDESGTYHLVDSVRVYMPHKVISMCSSTSSQQSFSDISGSDLTKSIVKNLNKLSIKDIMRSVTFDVTSVSKSNPVLYSTYPNIHHIFPWIIYNTKLTILIDKYNNDVKICK